jgi:hypothetical protein
MMFGGLRDKMEEALQARDEDEWRRLFDLYRIELLQKKDPNFAALLIQHIRTMRREPYSPSTRK